MADPDQTTREYLPVGTVSSARPAGPMGLVRPGMETNALDVMSDEAAAAPATAPAGEPIFTFTRPQFNRLMKEEGLEKSRRPSLRSSTACWAAGC
jgi:hypothetical protein